MSLICYLDDSSNVSVVQATLKWIQLHNFKLFPTPVRIKNLFIHKKIPASQAFEHAVRISFSVFMTASVVQERGS